MNEMGIFLTGYLESLSHYQKDQNSPVYYNLHFSAGRSGLFSSGCSKADYQALSKFEGQPVSVLLRFEKMGKSERLVFWKLVEG